ncbi:MAG: translocation/assembly module TamB domain-containing protein, partial [Paracoccaceae bacterium]
FTPLSGAFDGTITTSGRNLAIGTPEVDNLLRGPSRLTADLARDETGITLRSLSLSAQTLTATASGTLATDDTSLAADLAFADLSVLGPAYAGQLTAKATVTGPLATTTFTLDGTGTALGIGTPEVDALLAGTSTISARGQRRDGGIDLATLAFTASNLTATISGRIDPSSGHLLTGNLQFPNLSVLGPAYSGALIAEAGFAGTPAAGQITLDGSATNLGLGQPEINRILAGRSTVSAVLRIDDNLIQIDRARIENPQITASATGSVNGTQRNLDVTARLSNLALVLPDFPGAVSISGDVTQSPTGTVLDLSATGPGGIDASLTGTISPDYRRANLAITGQGQAGLANVFIDPGSLVGALSFDLGLNGPLSLASLSGRTTLSGGRYASPDLPFALADLAGTATITNGRANLDARASISTGGNLQLDGTVAVTPPFTADLAATLSNVIVRDARLFQTRGNGMITVQGPLTGGAQVAGRIALIETEIRVPNGSFVGVGAIPGLIHVNETAASRQTRLFAGLIAGADGSGRGGGTSRAYPLDLEISAPNRLFVRGRGLDAELGGTLRLRGTTANIIPDGAFSLIRGRLDILGKRLNLSEAELRLTGNFEPDLRILASNESDGITSSVLVEGNATDPQVSFTSNPELPEEEVLSRLLFGRALNTLSAFQAAQLAGAVATLAGRGGEGLMAKLRRGFGLDDFDVSTAEDGSTSVTAGKYISENAYTEIEVDQQGRSTVTLNLDVNENLTVRGSLGSDGQTGIGVFLEKDY